MCSHVVVWSGSPLLSSRAPFLAHRGCRVPVCAFTLFIPAKGRGAGGSDVERGVGSCVVLIHVTMDAKDAEPVALPLNSARRHQEPVVDLRARACACVRRGEGWGSCVVLVHVTMDQKDTEPMALPLHSARRHQEPIVDVCACACARVRMCLCACVRARGRVVDGPLSSVSAVTGRVSRRARARTGWREVGSGIGEARGSGCRRCRDGAGAPPAGPEGGTPPTEAGRCVAPRRDAILIHQQ